MPKKPKKVVAIVQARLGSIRFPKKVMADIDGKTLINLLLERLNNSKKIDQILLATSDRNVDDELEIYIRSLGFDVYRGSETDVLDRFAKAALSANMKVIGLGDSHELEKADLVLKNAKIISIELLNRIIKMT